MNLNDIIFRMVEGPGCKLKGEKLKSAVSGQKVLHVTGNVIDNRPKWAKDKETNFHNFTGKKVTDVKTLGKELFILFDYELCLRIHFLMEGYVSYNNQLAGFEARNKKPEKARLELTLSKDTVGFYLCSVETRKRDETQERWRANISLDVCWKLFDGWFVLLFVSIDVLLLGPRVADLILTENNKERMVVDVVMDQEIMPGVGNIIKNEGCFDAAINPLTKIKDLTRAHVVQLIKMLRDFSLLFYDCRKTGKSLEKHYKIYRFSVCGQCGGKVTRCKPGEYQRGTYFCQACQDNSLRSGQGRNSLLGWVRTANIWTCSVCTLENKPGSQRCSACGAEKSGLKSGLKRKYCDDLLQGQQCSEESKKMKKDPGPVVKTTKTVGEFTFTFKSRKESDYTSNVTTSLINQNHEPTVIVNLSNQKFPLSELCRGHQKACVKKTVSKEGPNKMRLFWACPLPQVKSCGHFSWADLHHPKCKHGNLTLLREVYKLNENNGRKFFICSKQKKDQCDFFQWND